MPKVKKEVAGTPADPTLLKTPLTIDGKEYSLCFDFGALAEAEAALIAEGHNVNLLAAIPALNLSNTRILFAAALRTFHPEIAFDQAMKMVTFSNVYIIAAAIADAWQSAIPEPEKGNAQAAE